MKNGLAPACHVPSGGVGDENWLFVYGTLKQRGGMERLMAGCTPIQSATVEGSLYDLGDYPALVLDGGGTVTGEVWRCPAETLERLDSYEGVPTGLFRRVRTMAGDVECWTYVAGPALEGRLFAGARIPNGSWPRRESGEGE